MDGSLESLLHVAASPTASLTNHQQSSCSDPPDFEPPRRQKTPRRKLNFLYIGVLGDLAVRFLLIIGKLPLQGRGWRSGYDPPRSRLRHHDAWECGIMMKVAHCGADATS
jgi:hypothetical protein